MPLCYSEEFCVCQFECDPWDRLAPAALLRRAQEIAITQCEKFGLDSTLYERTHTAFFVSRLGVEINTMPRLGERVRMETRAYGMRRALFHRFTSFYDQQGRVLCNLDSRWVLTDTLTHRILRTPPPEISSIFASDPVCEELDISLPKPGELTFLDELAARYSFCDSNAHINNTKYVELICDYLPLERLARQPLKRLAMSYRAEIPMGSRFTWSGTQAGPDGYCFAASLEGKRSFEGFASF